MAKLAIDRASIVFGKKSGDFHSESGDREIFIMLSKIGRSPAKSGDLEALFLDVTVETPFFCHGDNKVFVLFDPPHLLKSVRNNLKNHDFFSSTTK